MVKTERFVFFGPDYCPFKRRTYVSVKLFRGNWLGRLWQQPDGTLVATASIPRHEAALSRALEALRHVVHLGPMAMTTEKNNAHQETGRED